jgi:RNA polymerase sigma-70 factor (ECF subfamily)
MGSPEPRLSMLMRASLEGDRTSYQTLLGELTVLLRRYCQRRLGPNRMEDAEDMVQEALIAIHTKRATYDLSTPVTAWAHAIVRYKLVDHFRKSRVRATMSLDDVDEFVFGPDLASEAMARADVARVLDTLPRRTSRLIREVKLEGRSVAEIASETGLSSAAIKTAIHRGLKVLAARTAGKDEDA